VLRRLRVVVFYVFSVLGIVIISGLFVALCREPKCRTTYHVWYIRGRMAAHRQSKQHSAQLRRVA
jgi:hypothetical protein